MKKIFVAEANELPLVSKKDFSKTENEKVRVYYAKKHVEPAKGIKINSLKQLV